MSMATRAYIATGTGAWAHEVDFVEFTQFDIKGVDFM